MTKCHSISNCVNDLYNISSSSSVQHKPSPKNPSSSTQYSPFFKLGYSFHSSSAEETNCAHSVSGLSLGNGNTQYVSGYFTVVSMPPADYSKLIPKTIVSKMIQIVIGTEIQLFQLLKALSLFYKILPKMMQLYENIKKNKLYALIFIASVLMVSNRVHVLNINDLLYTFSHKGIALYDFTLKIFDILRDAYIFLEGFILLESTVDYGSNGSIDYNSLKYYINNHVMLEIDPKEYVAALTEQTLKYIAIQNEKNETVILYNKNIAAKIAK